MKEYFILIKQKGQKTVKIISNKKSYETND